MKKIGWFLLGLFCLLHFQLFPDNPKMERAFASLYDAYLLQSGSPAGTYIIPQKIHFIWLGSPLPLPCKLIIDSWKRFHPSWTVKVWTDADVANFSFRNKAVYDQAKNFGEKADILRYEILYSFGGIYADIDFECLKPFDSIAQTCEFFVGVENGSHPGPCVGNALIGSIPRHPILKYCIDSIPLSSQDHDLWRIVTETGPHHLTKCFYALAQHFRGRAVPFPRAFFYPLPITANRNFPREVIKKQWVRPESMAIHYWANTWFVHSPESAMIKEH
jgi:mannosyltransferase OCH1-like enzyme